MRILIATGIYPPDIGGPATYSKLLFDELPKRGIEVEVLSFGEVKHLPYIIRHIAYFFKILVRARKADIIFAQDPLGAGMPAGVAAKILRKKFLIKIVGDRAWETGKQIFNTKDSLDEFSAKWAYFSPVFIVKTGEWLTALLADKIIVPSEYLKRIVTNWGVKDEKIKVIYNAFSAPEIKKTKEEARTKLAESLPTGQAGCKLKADDFLIVSAGRLVPWKGFKTLIGIMPKILKEIPSAKLFIIGSGPDREALETTIANHGLRNTIFLLGQLPREELLLWLRAGDVFALNTGYEGFSHQLLEAMSVGIPVVTTNIGGNPEMIDNRKTGILVEYDDREELKKAIFELRENPDLKNKIVQNAQQKSAEFGKERMLSDLVEVLKDLLAAR